MNDMHKLLILERGFRTNPTDETPEEWAIKNGWGKVDNVGDCIFYSAPDGSGWVSYDNEARERWRELQKRGKENDGSTNKG